VSLIIGNSGRSLENGSPAASLDDQSGACAEFSRNRLPGLGLTFYFAPNIVQGIVDLAATGLKHWSHARYDEVVASSRTTANMIQQYDAADEPYGLVGGWDPVQT